LLHLPMPQSCVAAICCDIMQQWAAVPLAFSSTWGRQPSVTTQDSFRQAVVAQEAVAAAWEQAASHGALLEAAGAASALTEEISMVAENMLEPVHHLVNALSPWEQAPQQRPAAGGTAGLNAASTEQAQAAGPSEAAARGGSSSSSTKPCTWQRLTQELLRQLARGLRAWQACVVVAAAMQEPADAQPLAPAPDTAAPAAAASRKSAGSGVTEACSDMADSARQLRDQQQQQQQQQQQGPGAVPPVKGQVAGGLGQEGASAAQQGKGSLSGGVPHPLVAVVRMLLTALVARTQVACNK
jgi:hypothetical protein